LSAIGVILWLAYRLQRHKWSGWPLSRWLGLLLVVATVGSFLLWRARPWPALIPAALFLIHVLVLAWAGRQGYIHFRPISGRDPLPEDASPAPSLGTQELVPTRASGWFTVAGQERYYVDLQADFETVETREHIVLGRVHPSRFLVVGQWPKQEFGWWYVFFQPAMIRGLHLGHLRHGFRTHQALRVTYAPDQEVQQTVYFTFDDDLALRWVWDDLAIDAPPSAIAR
jgi:hypothetical protein